MNNSREMAATIVGAVIGGIARHLFFTERGRRVRRQIGPALDDFSRELKSFAQTVQKTGGAANDSWALLNDTLGEGWDAGTEYPSGQRSPF